MTSIIFPASRRSQEIHPYWIKEAKSAKSAGFSINTITDPNDAGVLRIYGELSDYRLLKANCA